MVGNKSWRNFKEIKYQILHSETAQAIRREWSSQAQKQQNKSQHKIEGEVHIAPAAAHEIVKAVFQYLDHPSSVTDDFTSS